MLRFPRFNSKDLQYTSRRAREIENFQDLSFLLEVEIRAVVPCQRSALEELPHIQEGFDETFVAKRWGYRQAYRVIMRQRGRRFHCSKLLSHGRPARYIVIELPIPCSNNVVLRCSL